ncbi:hypothetical protein [Treponema sp.]|uniref:hypothetical protein n=1 Tax=Treponema sp. TaxID=166 RepID=UPI00298EB682|nr:hypothetical protein [Treponema sp.]MCQ2242173.1 hypothetical protein [Treponema sp.]
MKKKLLFMFLAAGLFFAGCSDGSSGSSGGDDTPSLPGNPNPDPQNPAPQLPSTYIDISGTWYYTRMNGSNPIDEYKLILSYNENESLPDNLNLPLAVVVRYEIYDQTYGNLWTSGRFVYDRMNNRLYEKRSASVREYSEITKSGNEKISVRHYSSIGTINSFGTDAVSTTLSRTSGSSGSSDPQGPGNPGSEDLTLSGLYSVAEQSGVTLTFNSNGTWEKVYNGSQRKEGTFSQSGSTVTLTFNGKNAEFTVSRSNGKLILTAKNTSDADTISVIATGLQLSSSVASGKVTLSK